MSDSSFVSEEITLVWLLLMSTVFLSYAIQRWRFTSLPPSSCALLLGVVAGAFSRALGLAAPLRFSPGAFFYGLLPPIVFAAGFTLKKKDFFRNIGPIMTYACLGTLISALVFGLGTYFLVLVGLVRRSHLGGAPFIECMLYGSAISSIDPVATLAILAESDVPPLLYNLVFGESVLNDAVAIVLFRTLTQFYDTSFGWATIPLVTLRFCVLLVGSLAVGVGVALACAFALKRFQLADRSIGGELDGTLYEIALVVMASYLAYLLGEVSGMSGIVALFFSGICHAHYTYYNVTPESQVTTRRFFEVAAFLCELFIFSYLGMQVATMQHSFDFGLFFSGLPLAVLSRAANIFPCSRLINSTRRYKLPRNIQLMLWAVGLRGAVAYGLVINMPNAATGGTGVPAIETAALLIVLVTTLGLGSATPPLLRRFGLEGVDDAQLYGIAAAEEEALREGLDPEAATANGRRPPRLELDQRSALHDKFREIDDAFLKPLFGGRHSGIDDGLPSPDISYRELMRDGGSQATTPGEEGGGSGGGGAAGVGVGWGQGRIQLLQQLPAEPPRPPGLLAAAAPTAWRQQQTAAGGGRQ